jgi:hypothetical protein
MDSTPAIVLASAPLTASVDLKDTLVTKRGRKRKPDVGADVVAAAPAASTEVMGSKGKTKKSGATETAEPKKSKVASKAKAVVPVPDVTETVDATAKPKKTKSKAKAKVADETDVPVPVSVSVPSEKKPRKKRAKKDAVSGSATPDASEPKKKRPLSCFMVFSKTMRPKVVAENPGIKFTEVGSRLGAMWKALTKVEQDQYKSSDVAVSDAVPVDVPAPVPVPAPVSV